MSTATTNTHAREVNDFMNMIVDRNPGEPEFIQSVQEAAEVLIPFSEEITKYKDYKVLERIAEPERVFIFRVPWVDDKGEYHVNRGFRVQMNSAIGPYKGGLRFHPSVNLSILKFLAFEQVFKNSLTTLPLGGGKGGANFDPKGRTDNEVMRFCQSFMTELAKHIGASTDVPAGDIGVGAREIGYLFGQFKRIRDEFTGVITGKSIDFGGSLIRPEATGYGNVYFSEQALLKAGEGLEGKVCTVSGSGNVAQYTIEKLIHKGGKVVTVSDSQGCIYDPDGIDEEKLSFIKELKNVQRGRIKAYAEKFKGSEFKTNTQPWTVPCDLAYPSATQNELHQDDAEHLVKNGCMGVFEGANMPTTPDAIRTLINGGVIFAPGKASNAGGVATSGLEMSQNSLRLSWTREEVDKKLQDIMKKIHDRCVKYGENGTSVDYVKGANIAGFIKVADAMIDQGMV